MFDEAPGFAPARRRMTGRAVRVVGAGQQPVPGDPSPPLGNGRAIALLPAREGAHLACLDRNASARRPARAAQRLPFGREGTSWEVAYARLFLLSHEASFINAQVIVADGGITGLQLQ